MRTIDVKKVLNKAKERPTRVKVSFTFEGDLFEEFKTACEKEDVPQSRVLEALMREFLEGLASSGKK